MDERVRELGRALQAAPGDEAAASALLAALLRRGDLPEPVDQPVPHHDGRPVLGPLLAAEVERLRLMDPESVVLDSIGVGWVVAADASGRALYSAVLEVRVLELTRWSGELEADSSSGFALHAAIDHGGERALASIERVIGGPSRVHGERAARLLASRQDAAIGRRLAALAGRLPAEARIGIYAALAEGLVPLDKEARSSLRSAVARELPAVRAEAWKALRRGATVADLEEDMASGPPEIRGLSLEHLFERFPPLDGHDRIRRALVDKEPAVRLAAVKILTGPRWISNQKTADWVLGRLVDHDRAVRHAALRLLRRIQLSARQLPRLRLIVTSAPPGIRPTLERLLELAERRHRG